MCSNGKNAFRYVRMISVSQTKEWFAQDSFFCQELKKEEVSCALSMYAINILVLAI